MRGLLALCLVLGLILAVQPPIARASDGWCDTDPILIVRTPAGRLVPLYVTVGAQSLLFTPNTLLGSVVLSYTAVPTADAAVTEVSVVVNVRPSILASSFSTRQTVSTGAFGSGTVYARGYGVSGVPTTLVFEVPYP
jgi:hypothetical protein